MGIWKIWAEGPTNLYQSVREIFLLEQEIMRLIRDFVYLSSLYSQQPTVPNVCLQVLGGSFLEAVFYYSKVLSSFFIILCWLSMVFPYISLKLQLILHLCTIILYHSSGTGSRIWLSGRALAQNA